MGNGNLGCARLRTWGARYSDCPHKHMSSPSRTAAAFVPPSRSIPKLRAAASTCRGCGLWKNATQTVFGQGGHNLRVMFIGEQPGDQEDVAGLPFVGPAGKLLDTALQAARIDRDS